MHTLMLQKIDDEREKRTNRGEMPSKFSSTKDLPTFWGRTNMLVEIGGTQSKQSTEGSLKSMERWTKRQ